MTKLLSINDFLDQVEEEYERFIRYKTPFAIVAFQITFVDKDLYSNFLHKVVIELRNHLDKEIRKTDRICRHRNLLLVMLKNISIEQAKGFINRIFTSIDGYAKKSYKESNHLNNVTLVDVIIRVLLISYSDLASENMTVSIFNKKYFAEMIDNLEKYSEYEIWELRLPLIDKI